MSDTPSSDSRAEYAETLRARRLKVEPFVYACQRSGDKVKFAFPISLPLEAGAEVMRWWRRLGADDDAALDETPAVLRLWVGDKGYDALVKGDRLRMDEVMSVMSDALLHFQQVSGDAGESSASTNT